MLKCLADISQGVNGKGVWIALGVGGAMILWAIMRPNPWKKKKDPLSKPASSAAFTQQRQVERQMQNLLVELSEMARQITAQLDTRSQKLMSLIQEADEKIEQLDKAQNHRPVETPSKPSHDQPQQSEDSVQQTTPAMVEPPSAHVEVYTLADQGRSAPDIARELNRPRGEVELILALRQRS